MAAACCSPLSGLVSAAQSNMANKKGNVHNPMSEDGIPEKPMLA